ncbi:MAG TPA: DUF4397 domain-containing protein [Euzebyales bacterium]|nr:DUF4397 domain-containing protein [Euzebyales bacterium]
MSIRTADQPRRGTIRRRSTIALSAAALLVTAFAGPASAQSDEGTVTVVHGVPELTVDVYVNGDLTLEDFEPGTVTDPLDLPAGDYDVEIRAADEDPESDPAISGSAAVEAGANASLVAHLDADGQPTLSAFANDTSEIGAGDARVTVRHTAAAPAVDILAEGDAIVSGLSNPDEAVTEVPAGTYEVAVAPEGTTDAVLGPTDLTLEEGTNHIVYAIGSVDDDNLDLLVQTISGLHSSPDGVPAGTGGMADAMPTWLVALSAAAAAGAVVAGGRLAYARARS